MTQKADMSNNEQLLQKLHRLERLLHRAHHHMRPGGPPKRFGFDAHHGQGRILTLLSLKDGMRQRDIAMLLDIRPQSLGELVSKLEYGGYVYRESDPHDHRAQLVFLTDSGAQLAKQLAEPREHHEAEFLDVLDEDEKLVFGVVLDKLINKFESEIDAVADSEPFRHRAHPLPYPPGPYPDGPGPAPDDRDAFDFGPPPRRR